MRIISTGCTLGLLFAVASAGCGDSASTGSNDGGTTGSSGGSTSGSGGSTSGSGGSSTGAGGSSGGSAGSASGTGGSASGGGATCDKLCARGEALNCPMDKKGECAMQCAASPAKCKTQLDALAACSETVMFMCDADGTASAMGCDSEGSAYFTCILSN